MTPRLPPRHSEPVTDVTGVGIRIPKKRGEHFALLFS